MVSADCEAVAGWVGCQQHGVFRFTPLKQSSTSAKSACGSYPTYLILPATNARPILGFQVFYLALTRHVGSILDPQCLEQKEDPQVHDHDDAGQTEREEAQAGWHEEEGHGCAEGGESDEGAWGGQGEAQGEQVAPRSAPKPPRPDCPANARQTASLIELG